MKVMKRRFSKLRDKIISLITQFINYTLRLITQLLVLFVNGFIEKIGNKLNKCRPPNFIEFLLHLLMKNIDTKYLAI